MQDALFFLHFCIKWTRTQLTELEQTEFPKKFLIVSAFYSPLTRCSLSRVHSFRVEFGAPPCNKPSCTCRAGTLLCRWSTVREGLKTGWPIVPLCWRAECKTLFSIQTQDYNHRHTFSLGRCQERLNAMWAFSWVMGAAIHKSMKYGWKESAPFFINFVMGRNSLLREEHISF